MRRWLILLPIVSALGGAGWLARDLGQPYRGYSGSLMLTVEPGTRAPEVVEMLVSRGVLAHRLPFLLLHELGRARHRTLKAGEYLFDHPLRPIDVYRKLARGDVYLHAVLIPEGSDRFDMARIVQQQLGLDPQEFLRSTEQAALIRDLDPEASTLEGYLYPDTYRLPRTASAQAVVAAMAARFRQVLGSHLPAEMAHSPQRLREALTLASLVEKETPDPVERPVVAGVFARRLEKGMPLQSDPTVVYADRLAHRPLVRASGPITRSELAADSPYNTYLRTGLPPGPICSPGLASIRAALDPAPGSALYFVSNNRGGHVFANTLKEHEHNVARYRRELAALHHAAAEGEGGDKPASSSSVEAREHATTADGAKSKRGQKQKAAHP